VRRYGKVSGVAVACALVLAMTVGLAVSARAADEQWNKGSRWLSLRAGYAKSTEERAPNGNIGYGFGYTQFLSRKWAVSAFVHHEVLGRYGHAAQFEVPFTAELTRHFRWKTPLRPYLGMGGGAFYHKTYRTGEDTGSFHNGFYFTGGFNTTLDARHLLGVDTRVAFVDGDENISDPVFGPGHSNSVHWSVKLNWALAY
jgi:hypothetical protein